MLQIEEVIHIMIVQVAIQEVQVPQVVQKVYVFNGKKVIVVLVVLVVIHMMVHLVVVFQIQCHEVAMIVMMHPVK